MTNVIKDVKKDATIDETIFKSDAILQNPLNDIDNKENNNNYPSNLQE
jgi:hypothetical protein